MTPERRKLLADCAALARGLAREHCWHDAETQVGCAWYHGFWPYMRLLDYGSSPELHKAFYLDGLAPLKAGGISPRILISGAADFAMLEVARAAFADAPREPRFTVVDRCDTPLALCRWYAQRAGFTIETRREDLLRFDDDEGFDAIVTHSFLGSFPPDVRPDLAGRWFALLRPGGRLLTINRIRGVQARGPVPFSDDETSAFIGRLTADLESQRHLLDTDPADIAALARDYLREKRSYPVRTPEELSGLLEQAGFHLDLFNTLAAADPGETRPSGPTMPGKATYMKVIARRKA